MSAGGANAAAAAGGVGFFFFGLAALLALAGAVVPRVIWTLGTTARAAQPPPFVSLLERPG